MVRGIESFREWFSDMHAFFERMETEEVDLKQLGIKGKTKESILEQLRGIYR